MISEIQRPPGLLNPLQQKSEEIGFTMPSDDGIGSLLRTLVASRPNGRFLELGTGMGLSLSWIVDGMDRNSSVLSIDNDEYLIEAVRPYFRDDARVEIINQDGMDWILDYKGPSFDLIFADAWPGKYELLNETLRLLKPGGMYVVDDMKKQPNWPDGHEEKASQLFSVLLNLKGFMVTTLDWSTGIIICTKSMQS